eukprot:6203339-Pleurochrysis_carterae.AAC.2
MGVPNNTRYNEPTWLLGMSADGVLMPSTHLCVLRVYWRHVYAAMTRLKLEGDPFSSSFVKREIARTFYMCLLAYQHGRSLLFYRRRFSSLGNYTLPESAAKQVEPIGSLIRLVDGHLRIKTALIELLEQQGI